MLSLEEKEELAELVVEKLRATNAVSEEQILHDHIFIKVLKAREERAQQRWDSLKDKLIQSGVLGAFGALFALLALGVREWMRQT